MAHNILLALQALAAFAIIIVLMMALFVTIMFGLDEVRQRFGLDLDIHHFIDGELIIVIVSLAITLTVMMVVVGIIDGHVMEVL